MSSFLARSLENRSKSNNFWGPDNECEAFKDKNASISSVYIVRRIGKVLIDVIMNCIA